MNIKLFTLILFYYTKQNTEEVLNPLLVKKGKHYLVFEPIEDLENFYNPVLYLNIVFMDENNKKFRSLKKIISS